MSRPRPISDATADYMLAGGEVDDIDLQDLAQVLRSASAPGRAEELMREDAATAAFAAAHLAHSPGLGRTVAAHRRRPMIRSLLVNALGLKAALAALAAAAIGGLALAASTGVLPNPLNPVPASHWPSGDKTPGPSTPDTSIRPSSTPLRTSGPQLQGWCEAYLNAGSAEEKNKHLTADLVAAAGGADKVNDYCIALVGSAKPKPPAVNPSRAANPSKAANPSPKADHSREAKSTTQPSK